MKMRTSDYDAGCAGKMRFDQQSARDIAARALKNGDVLDAYRCRWCKGWHVGERRKNKTAATVKAENKRANRMMEEVG